MSNNNLSSSFIVNEHVRQPNFKAKFENLYRQQLSSFRSTCLQNAMNSKFFELRFRKEFLFKSYFEKDFLENYLNFIMETTGTIITYEFVKKSYTFKFSLNTDEKYTKIENYFQNYLIYKALVLVRFLGVKTYFDVPYTIMEIYKYEKNPFFVLLLASLRRNIGAYYGINEFIANPHKLGKREDDFSLNSIIYFHKNFSFLKSKCAMNYDFKQKSIYYNNVDGIQLNTNSNLIDFRKISILLLGGNFKEAVDNFNLLKKKLNIEI